MMCVVLRLGAATLIVLATACAAIVVPAGATPLRLTGWWLNPTPNNVWLRDGLAEYTVSQQGSGGADGDWPEFGAARFVRTNGGYGYGCARLLVELDGLRVVRIAAAEALPLKRCRTSLALRKAEPSPK